MRRRTSVAIVCMLPALALSGACLHGSPIHLAPSASSHPAATSDPSATATRTPEVITDPDSVFVPIAGFTYVEASPTAQRELERWARTNEDFDAAMTDVVVKALDDGSPSGPVGVMAIGVERPYANLFGLRQALPISIAKETGGSLKLRIIAHRSTYLIRAVAFGADATFITWQEDAVFLVAWGEGQQRVETVASKVIEATIGS